MRQGRTRRILLGVLLCGIGSATAVAQQLPPGVPPPAAGSGAGQAALTWTDPKGWVREAPSSSMRRAQYRIPGSGGEGECVVFYFGAGQGGDATSNAMRWADQFEQADGKPSRQALKTKTIDVGGLRVVLTEITGTYRGGMPGGPAAPSRSGYMLLGAIARGPDANWFFKATGPRQTMEANRAAFGAMVNSLRPGK